MKRLLRSLSFALVLLTPLLASADSSFSFPFVSGSTNISNCVVVVAGKHLLSGMTMGNTGTAAWIKFYDMSTVPVAGATQGSSVAGAPYPFPVPGATALAGTNTFPPFPLNFVSGIALCATGGAANNDATPLSAAQLAGTIFYQ